MCVCVRNAREIRQIELTYFTTRTTSSKKDNAIIAVRLVNLIFFISYCQFLYQTILCVCIYITFKAVCGVMVNIVGNGHSNTSSNPGEDWLHFILH